MSKTIKAPSGIVVLLVLQVSLALGGPIPKGVVPLNAPLDVVFNRGMFWMRHDWGQLFFSADQGKSWTTRELPRLAVVDSVALMTPDPASGGIHLTTYESALFVGARPNDSFRCKPMSLTEESVARRKQIHFTSLFVVGPNGIDRMGVVGVETAQGIIDVLYHSGGCSKEWRSVKSFPTGIGISVLRWPTARTLIAGNTCKQFLSRDGGANWRSVTFSPPTCRGEVDPERIASIQFFSESHGVLALQLGRVYSTNDGGLTWSMQHDVPLPTNMKDFRWPAARFAGAACFQSESVGWRITGDSELQMTTDGGKGWYNWGDLGPISRIVGPDDGACYVIANKQLFLLER